ncbi:MAG TPA: NUDIX domain-containing protein [Kofleriaceae bacterium]|nr:NUDIX domain-containing protein [Kofleriaceae bacterium]
MSTIREAASVILLRAVPNDFEVFLLRRHKKASFMASAFVFPGGATEEGEDARTAAARELFEEAGVLLARDTGAQNETLQLMTQDQLRHKVLAGAPATGVLEIAGLAWATDGLIPWSHWITPSTEPAAGFNPAAGEAPRLARRFSARFFVGEMPAGQQPQFDATETVDQVWVTPADALARAGELQLPPPQVRTFWELAHCHSIPEVMAAARKRADQPHPIMPRLAAGATAPVLLLPWDRDYTAGQGEATPLTYNPSWAIGPSRFVYEDKTWKHV